MAILDDIAESAEALTDPRHHAEPRFEWDHNRHRRTLAPHITTVPGLIQQLRDKAEPGASGDDTGGQVPGSRPPLDLNAVSLLAAISYGAARKVLDLNADPRDTPEANIRALVGWAGNLNHDAQHDLRRDLRSWRHQAEIICEWVAPPVELIAPCPVADTDGQGTPCGARGTLLAHADGSGARCTACNVRWDEGNVSVLFDHVRRYKIEADARAASARLRAREAKERNRVEVEEARERATRRHLAA